MSQSQYMSDEELIDAVLKIDLSQNPKVTTKSLQKENKIEEEVFEGEGRDSRKDEEGESKENKKSKETKESKESKETTKEAKKTLRTKEEIEQYTEELEKIINENKKEEIFFQDKEKVSEETQGGQKNCEKGQKNRYNWSALLETTNALLRSEDEEEKEFEKIKSKKESKKEKRKGKESKNKKEKREKTEKKPRENSESKELVEKLKREIEKLNNEIKELKKKEKINELERLHGNYNQDNAEIGFNPFDRIEKFQQLQQRKVNLARKVELLEKQHETQKNSKKAAKKIPQEPAMPEESKKPQTFPEKMSQFNKKYGLGPTPPKKIVVHFDAEQQLQPLPAEPVVPKKTFVSKREKIDLRKYSLRDLLELYNKKTKMNQLNKLLYSNLFGNEVTFAEEYLQNKIEPQSFKKCILTPMDHRAFSEILCFKFPKEFTTTSPSPQFPEHFPEPLTEFYSSLYSLTEGQYFCLFLGAYLEYQRFSIKNVKKGLENCFMGEGDKGTAKIKTMEQRERKEIMNLLARIEDIEKSSEIMEDILNNKTDKEILEKKNKDKKIYKEDDSNFERKSIYENKEKSKELGRRVIVVDEREQCSESGGSRGSRGSRRSRRSSRLMFTDSESSRGSRGTLRSSYSGSQGSSSIDDSDSLDRDSSLDISNSVSLESEMEDLSLGDGLEERNSDVSMLSEDSYDEKPRKKRSFSKNNDEDQEENESEDEHASLSME